MFSLRQTTSSTEQTEKIASDFAKYLLDEGKTDAFLAMYGDLGAGKTAFVRGLGAVIAPTCAVSSPTYAIVNEYRGDEVTLCHFDMYRITSEDDLLGIGFYDYEDCIIAAEWCENIPYALPDSYYRIDIRKVPSTDPTVFDSGERIITIEEVKQ